MDHAPMTDVELLRWLAEHGTDISEDELAKHWARVLERLPPVEEDPS